MYPARSAWRLEYYAEFIHVHTIQLSSYVYIYIASVHEFSIIIKKLDRCRHQELVL